MSYKLELENITKLYGENVVLHNVNLSLDNKHVYILRGKNGCGKTTLLNIISNYDTDYTGYYRSNDLSIAYLLQDEMLFRNLTVKDNLILQEIGIKGKSDKAQLDMVIEKLGLNHMLGKKISELSGGEKKKVSLGQIILKNADVILLDEPTANIQKEYAKELLTIIFEEFSDKILLISSHDKLYDEKDNNIKKILLRDGEAHYGV